MVHTELRLHPCDGPEVSRLASTTESAPHLQAKRSRFTRGNIIAELRRSAVVAIASHPAAHPAVGSQTAGREGCIAATTWVALPWRCNEDGAGHCWPAPSSCIGSAGRTRTCDMVVNSHPLYQLSYRGSGFDRRAGADPGATQRGYIKPLQGLQSFCGAGTALFRLPSARAASGAGHHRQDALRHREVGGIGHVEPAQKLGRRQIPGQPVLEEHPADRMQVIGQANEDVLSDGPGLRAAAGCRLPRRV